MLQISDEARELICDVDVVAGAWFLRKSDEDGRLLFIHDVSESRTGHTHGREDEIYRSDPFDQKVSYVCLSVGPTYYSTVVCPSAVWSLLPPSLGVGYVAI
jgi:hypothetical protein